MGCGVVQSIDSALNAIGSAAEFHQLLIGPTNKPMYQLIPLRGGAVTATAHTILLAGGSEGICRQYEQAVLRAARLILHSARYCNPASQLWVCSGGCAVEFDLYFAFIELAERFAAGSTTATAPATSAPSLIDEIIALHTARVGSGCLPSAYLSWGYRVLAAAMIEQPLTLLTNAVPPPPPTATSAGGSGAGVNRLVLSDFLRLTNELRLCRESKGSVQSRTGFVAVDCSELVSELSRDAGFEDEPKRHSAATKTAPALPTMSDAYALLQLSRNPSLITSADRAVPTTGDSKQPKPSVVSGMAECEFGVVESIAQKHGLIENLFAVLIQLLRVDDVVRVKRIPTRSALRTRSQFIRSATDTAAAAAAATSDDSGDSD